MIKEVTIGTGFVRKMQRIFFFVALMLMIVSCKKLVEVKSPSTFLTSDNVYADDATAAAVLSGIYTKLAFTNPSGGTSISGISLVSALSADELTLYGGQANLNVNLVRYYLNKLSAGSNTVSASMWNDFYSKLYIVNLAIERLQNSDNLTPSVRLQLLGEAKFLRAFFYFYLVNLYGDVPLTTTSDYRINSKLSRNKDVQVYQQIITDLKDAQGLLGDRYVAGDGISVTNEKVRPNKYAAKALLARVYLYIKDWSNAEMQASEIISSGIYDTVSLNSVFLKNSKEAIWQLQPVNSGWNTEDARIFVIPSTGPTSNSSFEGYPVYLSNMLLNSFEPNDNRKINWVGNVTVGSGSASGTYYFPFKYKSATLNAPVTEYTMMLRLGEQYLIRAEARLKLDKITECQNDLNVIRRRAGLTNVTTSDKTTLLNIITHERQVELFSEWGHRWLDIKRMELVDKIMNSVVLEKNTTWNSNWQWYPIPLYEIVQNTNLLQNDDY